jgi:hypothetical protein
MYTYAEVCAEQIKFNLDSVKVQESFKDVSEFQELLIASQCNMSTWEELNPDEKVEMLYDVARDLEKTYKWKIRIK